MVQSIGSALHLMKVMAVIAGSCFLLAALAHNVQLFPTSNSRA
jgi:hypothetical protein